MYQVSVELENDEIERIKLVLDRLPDCLKQWFVDNGGLNVSNFVRLGGLAHLSQHEQEMNTPAVDPN